MGGKERVKGQKSGAPEIVGLAVTLAGDWSGKGEWSGEEGSKAGMRGLHGARADRRLQQYVPEIDIDR